MIRNLMPLTTSDGDLKKRIFMLSNIDTFIFWQEIDRLQAEADSNKKAEKMVPATNYKDKYKHLIGDESAKDGAKQTLANKSYGFGKVYLVTHDGHL